MSSFELFNSDAPTLIYDCVSEKMGTAIRGIVPPAQHLPPWSPVLQAVVATAVAVILALLLTLLLYCLYITLVSRRMKKLNEGVETAVPPPSADAEREEKGKKMEVSGGEHWRECFVPFPDLSCP